MSYRESMMKTIIDQALDDPKFSQLLYAIWNNECDPEYLDQYLDEKFSEKEKIDKETHSDGRYA